MHVRHEVIFKIKLLAGFPAALQLNSTDLGTASAYVIRNGNTCMKFNEAEPRLLKNSPNQLCV